MKRLLQILFEECLCYITLLKVQGKKHFLWLTYVLVFKKPCLCLFFAGLIFKPSSTVQLCYYFFFFKWCKMLCIYQSSNSVLFFPYPILMFIFVSVSLWLKFLYPALFATMRQSAWLLLRFSTCFLSLLNGLYSFFIIFTRFCGRLMSFPSFFSHLSRFSFLSPFTYKCNAGSLEEASSYSDPITKA